MTVKTVFISYNHGNSETADKLKTALEQKGIVVRIDNAVMEAGADIQEFIETSVRESDVTLSIVSNQSLLSAWVALESVNAFYNEKLQSSKKFIACYIDDDFFKSDFRLTATKQIDAKIEEIDNLIPKYNALKLDTNDLNSQKTRLYKLRNNLGDILLKLKDSLTLDIREPEFDKSLNRIVKAIASEPESSALLDGNRPTQQDVKNAELQANQLREQIIKERWGKFSPKLALGILLIFVLFTGIIYTYVKLDIGAPSIHTGSGNPSLSPTPGGEVKSSSEVRVVVVTREELEKALAQFPKSNAILEDKRSLEKAIEDTPKQEAATLVSKDEMPPWLRLAFNEIGQVEIPGNADNPRIIEYIDSGLQDMPGGLRNDELPWVSFFVNWCFTKSGLRGNKNGRALSWLNWGKALEKPQLGCVAIFQHSSGSGSVGFYLQETSTEVIGIFGNQRTSTQEDNGGVRIAARSKAFLKGYRWPIDYLKAN